MVFLLLIGRPFLPTGCLHRPRPIEHRRGACHCLHDNAAGGIVFHGRQAQHRLGAIILVRDFSSGSPF